MTIKKMMMAAGAVDGPQVIAPSSNDWDYTFAANEWPAAGNTLGDHTIGGYIDNIGGDSALGSLITFDGDFEVEFTFAGIQNSAFGVHALTDDDHRATEQYLGAKAMTNSFSWIEAGTNPKDFFIGSTAQSDTHTFATGSVVKIERVSGTITIYDDDVSVHVFGTTYSGAMRVWFGAGGAPFTSDLDNILFTDTEKVQRDGFYGENINTSRSFGGGVAHMMGTRFIATRSGSVTSVMCNVHSVSTGFNTHAEMWLGTSTSPTSQVGSDSSNTQSFSSTGEKTFTFTDVTLTKGQVYWFIVEDDNKASGDVNMKGHTAPIGDGAYEIVTGRHSTITSITDNLPQVMAMEVVVDTSDGEPTPDHDTLLLIHSDTSDGSTTFVDSSPFGRTDTVAGNTQHDTAQKKFGASAILFDGTGDYLTYPDSSDWKPAAITIDLWIRLDTNGISQPIMWKGGGGSASAHAWYLHISGSNKIEWTVSNGSSSVTSGSTTGMSTGTWYHIAAVYNSNGGGSGIWVNGTSEATNSSLVTIQDYSVVVKIGTDFAGRYFDGWMDEIRISKTARWEPGVNFTPPTSAYS